MATSGVWQGRDRTEGTEPWGKMPWRHLLLLLFHSYPPEWYLLSSPAAQQWSPRPLGIRKHQLSPSRAIIRTYPSLVTEQQFCASKITLLASGQKQSVQETSVQTSNHLPGYLVQCQVSSPHSKCEWYKKAPIIFFPCDASLWLHLACQNKTMCSDRILLILWNKVSDWLPELPKCKNYMAVFKRARYFVPEVTFLHQGPFFIIHSTNGTKITQIYKSTHSAVKRSRQTPKNEKGRSCSKKRDFIRQIQSTVLSVNLQIKSPLSNRSYAFKKCTQCKQADVMGTAWNQG